MSNQSPIVSFIIPVYNSEDYLAECLDSIVGQTIKDIEIICINDCSTDSSATLLEAYSAQDSRFKVIHLPANNGPGNARNIGIDHASGNYIRMVDSDDFIPLNSTEKLIEAANRYKSDFVKAGYRHCTNRGAVHRKGGNYPPNTESNVSTINYCRLWNFDQHTTFLFNTAILKESGTRYRSMSNGQDVVFLAELTPFMNRVTCIPETVYFYRANSASTTRRKRNVTYFKNIFRTYSAIYEQRCREEHLESADYYLFHRLTGIFASNVLPSIYSDLKHEEIKEVLSIFKTFLTEFDIIPRIYTHKYSWQGAIKISDEIIYLMTILLHADIRVATSFFYHLNENKIGKTIRTKKEVALRKTHFKTQRNFNKIRTSTSWRLTAPLRSVVTAVRRWSKVLSPPEPTTLSCSDPQAVQNHQNIFQHKFINNTWISDESVSGRGSALAQTRVVRRELPRIFEEYQIKTVVDIPCGDFYWMSTVDLSGVEYLGLDIVEELVVLNNDLYGSDTLSFQTGSLTERSLDKADLVLCRDCLVHFCFDDIFRALENIKKSPVTYLLTTTFPDRPVNEDIKTGQWRPLNLQAAPFNFPPPILLLNEHSTEASGKYDDKSLGLWKVSDLFIPETD